MPKTTPKVRIKGDVDVKLSGGATLAEQTEQTAALEDILTALNAGVGVLDRPLKVRMEYDENGKVLYLGKAVPGTLEDDNSWRIEKWTHDVDGNLTAIDHAGGDGAYSYAWTEREGYAYS